MDLQTVSMLDILQEEKVSPVSEVSPDLSLSELFVPETQCSDNDIDQDDLVTIVKETPPSSPNIDEIVKPSPNQAIKEFPKQFTTGCSVLDNWLGGGVPTYGITEFYGEKLNCTTEICLQLSVTAQLPKKEGGLEASVLWIWCHGGEFPSDRFNAIAGKYQDKLLQDKTCTPSDNVYILKVKDSRALKHMLEFQLDVLVKKMRKPLGIIIIDNLSFCFAEDLSSYSTRMEMSLMLYEIGYLLTEHSGKYSAAVVVSNQATINPVTGCFTACLGVSWRKMVHHRIMLRKIGDSHPPFMKIDFSNKFAQSSSISFIVTAHGIQGIQKTNIIG